ncbi:MAG: metallophosphoesterase family protein [Bacteroidia bacterium]
MKIGIISDTHSYLDERILHHLSGCDEIWHAGDFGSVAVSDRLEKLAPVVGVFGNIDGQDIRKKHPEHERMMREGMSVWMTHIGGYPGRYNSKLLHELNTDPPDLFISGHSHILKIVPDKKRRLLHINPGAAGRSGFHKVRTLVLMELLQGKVAELKVVELGPRTAQAG